MRALWSDRQSCYHKVSLELEHVGLLSELVKNLLMGLFLMGCSPGDFQEGKQPSKAFGKRPIEVGKWPTKEGKRPIKANGLFSGTPPWWKTTPLKGPIKRSMSMFLPEEVRPPNQHGIRPLSAVAVSLNRLR